MLGEREKAVLALRLLSHYEHMFLRAELTSKLIGEHLSARPAFSLEPPFRYISFLQHRRRSLSARVAWSESVSPHNIPGVLCMLNVFLGAAAIFTAGARQSPDRGPPTENPDRLGSGGRASSGRGGAPLEKFASLLLLSTTL